MAATKKVCCKQVKIMQSFEGEHKTEKNAPTQDT